MGRPRDAAKERYWRNVIRRHAASGLGARRFCVREGVAESRFHCWRRMLRERDEQQAQAVQDSQAAGPSLDHAAWGISSPFLPVQLPLSVAVPIEVVHPRGHVIRIPAVFDAGVLGRILATLDAPLVLPREV